FYLLKKDKREQKAKGLPDKKNLEDLIQETDYKNLDLLPADTRYRQLDSFISEMKNSDKWLRKLLKPVKKQYDYIIIDCPPNITALSENILKNSDAVLVPVYPLPFRPEHTNNLENFLSRKNLIIKNFTHSSQW